MATIKKPLKILYNEYHSSIPSKKISPQGGPLRFSQNFRNFFLAEGAFELSPLLFSYGDEFVKPFSRVTKVGSLSFNEIVYDSGYVRKSYKMDLSKSQLIQYFQPILEELETVFDLQKPDVVFLNGFSLANWWILYVAHKKNVPVVIQHAGIWKKEIMRGKDTFSAALRKIFYDMERDTIKWCAHHIFLNEFSKKVFMNLYSIKRQKSFASSIIPLPIELPVFTVSHKSKYNKEGIVNIGMVARWDSIKNHSALLRLAQSTIRPKNWMMHSVVAVNASRSDFAKEYVSFINIVEPMPPEKLTGFYQAMDIILLPSNFDVSPTVAAEALLVGKPVIISDQVGWVNDFIKFGLKDHIVSPKISGAALVLTIQNVVHATTTNNKKYTSLVKQIRYDHEPKRVFKQYASVFNSVVK